MEQRKLIKLGNSSFALALPKNWIDKSGLKKGDKIFLEENTNGELKISCSMKKERLDKEISIDINDKLEEEIARDIISAYVSGNTLINVSGPNDKIKLAKIVSKGFLNLEIESEGETKASFKDLVDLSSINIENMIRRMDNNTREMFSVLLSALEKKSKFKDLSKELNEIDKDTTKLYFFLWRFMNIGIENPSLQSSLKMSPQKFISLFWMAYNLEQIGDGLKRTAKKLENTEIIPELKELVMSIHENYSKSMKSFFDKNKNLAREVILKKRDIMKESEKFSEMGGFEVVSEKLQQINANIHSNSKMIFYGL